MDELRKKETVGDSLCRTKDGSKHVFRCLFRQRANRQRTFDLNSVVENALSAFPSFTCPDEQSGEHAIRVCRDLQCVPRIRGNAAEVVELVIELLANAIESLGNEGRLEVRTRPEGRTVILEIEDTGTGMSDRVLERCLDPFYTTHAPDAAGLGLSIARAIAERQEGRMEIHSQLGTGTTVRIVFPDAACRMDGDGTKTGGGGESICTFW